MATTLIVFSSSQYYGLWLIIKLHVESHEMQKEKKKKLKSLCGPFGVVQVVALDREKHSNNRDWQILENLAIDSWKFLRSFSKPHL